MPQTDAVLFYINKTFEVYKIQIDQKILECVEYIEASNTGLNLAGSLEKFFASHEDLLLNYSQIVFIIGEQAGFTDTRMLDTWLKTTEMFRFTEVYRLKLAGVLSLGLYNFDEMRELFIKALENKTQEGIYHKPPRLG